MKMAKDHVSRGSAQLSSPSRAPSYCVSQSVKSSSTRWFSRTFGNFPILTGAPPNEKHHEKLFVSQLLRGINGGDFRQADALSGFANNGRNLEDIVKAVRNIPPQALMDIFNALRNYSTKNR